MLTRPLHNDVQMALSQMSRKDIQEFMRRLVKLDSEIGELEWGRKAFGERRVGVDLNKVI